MSAAPRTLPPSCSSRSAGLDLQIVPYRGTPDVIVALLRNDVAMLVEFYAPIKSTLLDNKIRAIATSGPQRSPFFADMPTVAEAGVAGYEVMSWNGLFAPIGTPVEIIDLLTRRSARSWQPPRSGSITPTLASKPRPARPSS